MAAPTYGHDLTDWIVDSDTAAWTELANAAGGGQPDEQDTESALQGTNSCSQSQNTTSACSLVRILASALSLAAGEVVFVWGGHGVATALLSYASDGFAICFATDVNNWKGYTVAGNDVAPYPYGKWINHAVDPGYDSDNYDISYGTPPSGTSNIYGIAVYSQLSQNVAKGQPFLADIIRYGRGESQFSDGDSGTPATFAGFAAINDTVANRLGLIQAVAGGFQWKGLMTLGYGSTAVYMVDQNQTVFVQDCRKAYSGFNKIEIRVATSVVYWTNMTFNNVSPSTNVSPGALEMIDAADVQMNGCTFLDWGTFIFLSSAEVLGCTFVRCGQITVGGADFTGTKVLQSSAAVDGYAVYWDESTDPDGELDDMTITKGANAHHAIYFGASIPSSITLRGLTFSGFNASDSQNDSTLYFADTGGTITLNLIGCSGDISVKTAGCTISKVINPVTTLITVLDAVTKSALPNVAVCITAKDGTGPLPYKDSVSIVQSGGTATVTHTAHGLSTNQKVFIEGADQAAYNGIHTITWVSADSYSYTVPSGTPSPATGTITSTAVVIDGLTDASGQISDNRSLTGDQPISGPNGETAVRSGSGTIPYIDAEIVSEIDSTGGVSITVLLNRDA